MNLCGFNFIFTKFATGLTTFRVGPSVPPQSVSVFSGGTTSIRSWRKVVIGPMWVESIIATQQLKTHGGSNMALLLSQGLGDN